MLTRRTFRRLLQSFVTALLVLPGAVAAAVFDGGGINAGLNAAGGITGLSHRPIREVIVIIIIRVLDFLALAAVVVIIYAGIRLIVSIGEESARENAQKILLYTVMGLCIVLLSRVIVAFILSILGAAA